MQITLKHIILVTLGFLLLFAIYDSNRASFQPREEDYTPVRKGSKQKGTPSETHVSAQDTEDQEEDEQPAPKPSKNKAAPSNDKAAAKEPVDDKAAPPSRTPLVMVMVTTNRTRGDGTSGSTLIDTLANMMELITPEEKKVSKLIVINNQIPYDSHDQWEEVTKIYKTEIKSGWMKMIENPHEGYAKKLHVDNMRLSHGDPLPRKVWRAKEVLDFAYAMEVAEPNAQYVLFLEDDLNFSNHFITRALHTLSEAPAREAEYSFLSLFNPHDDKYPETAVYKKFECCTQAMIWHHKKIADVVKYAREEYDQNPLDWAMNDYINKKGSSFILEVPNTVQHVAGPSSFGLGFGGALHYSKSFDPEPQYKDYNVDYSALYDDDAQAAKYYNDRQPTVTSKKQKTQGKTKPANKAETKRDAEEIQKINIAEESPASA